LAETAKLSCNLIDAKHWAQASVELELQLKAKIAQAQKLEHAHEDDMKSLYSKKSRWAQGKLPEKYAKHRMSPSAKADMGIQRS
jgi:Ni/Co efflux regulator RcnB